MAAARWIENMCAAMCNLASFIWPFGVRDDAFDDIAVRYQHAIATVGRNRVLREANMCNRNQDCDGECLIRQVPPSTTGVSRNRRKLCDV